MGAIVAPGRIPGGKPGGTTARGYGADHQRLRAWWKPRVETGRVGCARCGQLIVVDLRQFGDGWQLDHDPTDPTRRTYLGPSHTLCNQGGAPPGGPTDPDPISATEW